MHRSMPRCILRLRGTDADFVLLSRRYDELCAAQAQDAPLDAEVHARLDHAFHLSICEASHNPVLVHTLRSLTDLLLSSVFAAISNLYHRMPHKQMLDSQHAELFRAVISRRPDLAQRAALDHLRGISDSLREIEKEEQRLIRSGLRLNGWK
jgi:GntR family transcriptional activator of glc operon